MSKSVHVTQKLKKSEIQELVNDAESILDQLITDRGIYASSSEGWKGVYHAWFGRDSAITADLISSALSLGGSTKLAKRALDALLSFAHWQGTKDDVKTGQELGKIPHEIREIHKENEEIHSVLHAANTNKLPWYVDKGSGLMLNWDSCDSTPLWIIAVVRLHKRLGVAINKQTSERIRAGLLWCLRNLEQCNGLACFVSAREQKGRIYSGLDNQGWKDSLHIYQYPDGSLARHPIKDILINAEVWTALHLGAEVFQPHDRQFAEELKKQAELLKRRINTYDKGFLYDTSEYEQPFFAEIIDGDNKKLARTTIDIPACLWANYQNEAALASDAIPYIVRRTMSEDMFNPLAGIRNYGLGTEFKQGTGYHGGSNVYWPFMSALVSVGFNEFGYKGEAKKVASALLTAIKANGSNIEMFLEEPDGSFANWHHPTKTKHQSAVDQAWTAAGVYYCGHMLLAD